jgi:hypothetical protein
MEPYKAIISTYKKGASSEAPFLYSIVTVLIKVAQQASLSLSFVSH